MIIKVNNLGEVQHTLPLRTGEVFNSRCERKKITSPPPNTDKHAGAVSFSVLPEAPPKEHPRKARCESSLRNSLWLIRAVPGPSCLKKKIGEAPELMQSGRSRKAVFQH